VTAGPVDYDAELTRYDVVLRRAWAVQPRDRILDIGCGTGQTSRQAARMAPAGRVLGVDVSAPALERARELARADGLRNVTFECADAQVHRFAPGSFELAISRFGTMFFEDPIAAFGNVGRALRPAGRLVMLVWQVPERNEWDVAIRRALTGSDRPPAVTPDRWDPFALADPTTVETILRAAGFTGIALADVAEPVYYGPDVAAALDWVRGFAGTKRLLARLDPGAARGALARLRDMLTDRLSDDGVWFASRAWLVTAHRG
jgi:SAM-dependent methyltransferase